MESSTGGLAMFLDPSQFEFVAALEAQWESIRAEYVSLPDDLFDPWVQQTMHGGGWSVYGLFAVGQEIPGACAACPNTARALRQVPGLSIAGFSRLAPHTHVIPHTGWAASVYRLHLPLVVPPGCRLRVAAETRAWQKGRCLIFDDTVEHEAWNDSDLARGVLLLDFLRPGMSDTADDHLPEEVKQYVTQLFADRAAGSDEVQGEAAQQTNATAPRSAAARPRTLFGSFEN
jgi:beta-hydroxylase